MTNRLSAEGADLLSYLAQVFLGNTGAHDIEGNELPRLVYVSREKRPGYQHHKKAGAENALVLSNILVILAILFGFGDCEIIILSFS